MSIAKITLIGLYNYMNAINDPLFANLTVPSGMNRDLLINTILLRGGEFEALYADGNFMKFAIGAWSAKWQYTLKKWYDAQQIKYDPLENYDRREDWTDTNAKNNELTNMRSDFSEKELDGSVEEKNSAFNDSDYTPASKSISNNTDNSTFASNSLTNGKESETGVHSGRTHGNIGVTTSQQMLQSEYDVARFNIYDAAADLFCSELCIFVYA